MKMIAVHRENHSKPVNTFLGRNAELMNVKRISLYELGSVKFNYNILPNVAPKSSRHIPTRNRDGAYVIYVHVTCDIYIFSQQLLLACVFLLY